MMLQTIAPKTTLVKITAASSDEQIISLWLLQKSEATQKLYQGTSKQFLNFTDGKVIAAVTLDDLLAWVSSLGELSQNTQRNKIATVKSLFSFAVKIGYLPVNPALMLKQPKEHDCRVERILTKDQVKAIANNADSFRNEMVVKALYGLGLRVSELINVCWDDFTQTDSGIKLKVIGKGSKIRYLIVPASLYTDLLQLRKDSDSKYVFSSRKGSNGGKLSRIQVYRIIKSLGDLQYIKATPHYLRHSHATHSLANGCDLNLLSSSLGHGNIAITSRYLHASNSDGSANYIEI